MNCDALASTYFLWEYAAFGSRLQRCRTVFLHLARGRQRALILGEGDGRFLARLLQLAPEIEVDCVDSSSRMLQTARRRALPHLHHNRVRFIHADAQTVGLAGQGYDLIVTHFFLDCFNAADLETLIARLGASATTDARWLLADFQEPAEGWPRLRARVWLAMLYRLFGWTTGLKTRRLIDPTALLQRNGWIRREQTSFEWQLLRSEVWELPRPLRHAPPRMPGAASVPPEPREAACPDPFVVT